MTLRTFYTMGKKKKRIFLQKMVIFERQEILTLLQCWRNCSQEGVHTLVQLISSTGRWLLTSWDLNLKSQPRKQTWKFYLIYLATCGKHLCSNPKTAHSFISSSTCAKLKSSTSYWNGEALACFRKQRIIQTIFPWMGIEKLLQS